MKNEVIAGMDLLKYVEEMLSDKKIVLKKHERNSLYSNIGGASVTALRDYVKKISEGQRLKEPNDFDLIYKGISTVFKKILKEKGCSKKEIDEFCSKIDLRYKQLQSVITPSLPYIV